MATMAENRLPQGAIFPVFDIFVLANSLHSFMQLRIVDMTDSGEQVVFYLEIQTTQTPGNQLTVGRKVCGGAQMVLRTFMR